MNGPPLIVGLDIGTTKVCTLVGTLTDDHKVEVRGVGMHPSVGLRRGVVLDIAGIADCVRRSHLLAQQMAGQPLTGAHVYVGVTGEHVDSFNTTGAVDIQRPKNEILPSDVERVLTAASNGIATVDRDIILDRPREYIVDGRRGISDPVHMTGTRLEVVLHVVTGQRRFLNDVRASVEKAELPVDSLVLEAVATGEAVTTPEERQLGVAVLDLGGGTADLAVYLDGSLAHTSAIPVGGCHVTYDLSYGLQAPYPSAEQIKVQDGCALLELCDPDKTILYRDVHGEECARDHAFLAEIIGPRMEELFELVLADMTRVGIGPRQLGAGLVLTGGGCQLTGSLPLARQKLGVMVREGRPLDVTGHAARVALPQFATAVGLVRCGGLDQLQKHQVREASSVMGKLRTFWRNFARLFD
ncbi:MAG: cell division protein FtsA [Armatimonadetes bacterium]|nr:cell division protein FtsA [Armatimonadota bacterium]